MAEDDKNKDVLERNKEVETPGSRAVARDSQEKSQDQVDKESKHAEMRLQGRTPSSAELPTLDMLFQEHSLKPEKGSASPGDSATAAVDHNQDQAEGKTAEGKVVKLQPVLITADYTGEGIKREVEPGVVKAEDTKGKSLSDLARDHLAGTPPPTDEQIQQHAKELAKVNHMTDVNKPLDGSKPVTMPGHDQYGGWVAKDDDGNKRTVYKDGTVVVQNADGSGYDRHVADDGSYKEHHWGTRPQDNYELRRNADGKIEVADAGKDNFHEPAGDKADHRVEKAKLLDKAEAKITDPTERARFEADLDKMETRERQLQDRYEKQGMSFEDAQKKAEENVAKTYQEVGKLLDAPDNPKLPLKEGDRIQLAEQVMHQAANPSDVSQGNYSTCNVATIENQTYSTNPAEAARLVRQVATEGQYTTNGTPPVTVQIDKQSLERSGDSDKPYAPGENRRSYASQIFQVTATNIHYAKENAKSGDTVRYEQGKPGPDKGPDTDSGERLVRIDPKTGKKEKISDSPDLNGHAQVDIAREINPEQNDKYGEPPVTRVSFDPNMHDKVVDLENKKVGLELAINGVGDGKPLDLNDPEAFRKARESVDNKEGLDADKKAHLKDAIDKLERDKSYTNIDGTAYVSNKEQLDATLDRLQKEGRMPVKVGVDTGVEPFRSDAGDTKGGGAHVVVIKSYDAGPPAKVQIDNQYDKSADHDLSTQDLYKAVQYRETTEQISRMNKTVEQDKAGHTPHDNAKLERDICTTFEGIEKNKDLSKEERQRLLAGLMKLRNELPPEEQTKLNEQLKQIQERYK
jgi:hypothetical protein